MSYIWQVISMLPQGGAQPDTCEIRNTNATNIVSSGTMVAEVGISRDASVISGGLTQFGYSEDNATTLHYWYPYQVIRNGNCLYYQKVTPALDAAGEVTIAEYNLITEVETTIVVLTLLEVSVVDLAMSFIVERKLLVLVKTQDDYGEYNKILIVNFETTAVTETTTHSNSLYIRTLKKASGDVWLYVFCSAGTNAYDMKYKNFTQDTAWGTLHIDVVDYNEMDNVPIFIGEDYIVWFTASYGTPPLAQCVVWDLNSNTVSLTNTVTGPSDASHWHLNYTAPDFATSKAYVIARGHNKIFPSTPPWDAFEYFLEVNPLTLSLSIIYSRENYDPNILISMLFSSKTKAYFGQYGTNYIFEASSMTNLGTLSVGFGTSFRFSNLLDDSGLIWWYNNAGSLVAAGLDGVTQYTISVAGIIVTSNDIHVLHSKNSIVLVCRKTTYPNYYFRFYLVT